MHLTWIFKFFAENNKRMYKMKKSSDIKARKPCMTVVLPVNSYEYSLKMLYLRYATCQNLDLIIYHAKALDEIGTKL